jgi:hypothetical protein
MINRLPALVIVLMLGLLLPTAVSRAFLTGSSVAKVVEEGGTAVPREPYGGSSQPPGLITNWYSEDPQSIRKGAGIVSYYNLSVFGQNICTSYGDPFSPLNSPWVPGPYTYQYRLRIPADYPHNTVRVELFDPDSMNRDNPATPLTIFRTNVAIDAGLTATTTGNCATDRRDNCIIDTGELTLVENGTLTLEPINPYWFYRVDENRGAGSPPGNGVCGVPASYNENYNTRTLFELWYWHENPDGTIVRQDLARYTGQVGGGRDDGAHDTDLRWVSPGAAQSYDQPVFVPADAGSPGNFEIDLTAETPGIIIDPLTGDRYVNLSITGLDGASENGFDIWAGPPTYVSTIASDVNARNLQALNSPGSHSSQGIEVTAVNYLLLNQNYQAPLDMPLVELDAAYAGTGVHISMFDSDSGAQPPITFTVDSITPADWSLVFAQDGIPDPDGQVRNCLPGDCNNLFITPPYAITVPSEEGCDYTNPDPQNCTPFYGGTLTARYHGGWTDTYLWSIPMDLPPVANPTAGCSAFPIALDEGIRSVTPPGTGANPFPDTNEFQNPNPPTYTQFINHVPDSPLLNANPGYVYRLWNGFGSGNFGWLRWNEGQLGNNNNLVSSMTWPGNSRDYADHNGEPQGQPVPGSGYNYPVWGYIEPGDPTDQQMHLGDWVAVNAGVANSSALRDVLNEHIALGRVLRLPIWNESANPGSNGRYHISHFALFRVQGYNLQFGWLLLEFISWDESCGQPNAPLSAVSINGPTEGIINTSYTFIATAVPLHATTPITYVWQIDGHAPITNVSGITDVVSLSWPITGTYTLTVTAVNSPSGPATAVHHLTIEQLQPDLTVIGPPQLVTPLPVGAGLPVSFTVTISNAGDVDVDSLFFVDVYIDPTIVLSTGIPISQSSGFTAVPALAAGDSITLTINAPLGFADLPPTHTVYAMVDSADGIGESDETNNVSASLTVTAVHPLLNSVTIFGPQLGLTGETYTFTAVVTPTTITDPITYTWFVDDTPTLTITNGTAVPISLTFPLTGSFDLLVMASHGFNTVTDTHTIVITDTAITDLAVIGAPQLLTPGLIQPEQPVSFTVTIQNVGNVPLTGPIQTDIFLHPAIVLSTSIPISQSNGFLVVNGLGVGETAVLTFTIPTGFGPGPLYRQVYAMVDSGQAIPEVDETNNISLPLELVVGRPLYLPIVLKP